MQKIFENTDNFINYFHDEQQINFGLGCYLINLLWKFDCIDFEILEREKITSDQTSLFEFLRSKKETLSNLVYSNLFNECLIVVRSVYKELFGQDLTKLFNEDNSKRFTDFIHNNLQEDGYASDSEEDELKSVEDQQKILLTGASYALFVEAGIIEGHYDFNKKVISEKWKSNDINPFIRWPINKMTENIYASEGVKEMNIKSYGFFYYLALGLSSCTLNKSQTVVALGYHDEDFIHYLSTITSIQTVDSFYNKEPIHIKLENGTARETDFPDDYSIYDLSTMSPLLLN